MVNAVSTDVDRLLGSKRLSELTALEKQISDKLSSNEPIDVEYWEQLFRSIMVYKSKAELDGIYKSVIQGQLRDLQDEQNAEADLSKKKLCLILADYDGSDKCDIMEDPRIKYSPSLDPEPQLKLLARDKALDVTTTEGFVDRIVSILFSENCKIYLNESPRHLNGAKSLR